MCSRPRTIAAYVAFYMVIPAATVAAQVVNNAALNVPPGKVVVLRPGNTTMLVDRFTMGDDSQLVISDDTPLLIIRARAANIGNGATILGRGRDGRAATGPGATGEPGARAPSIVLIVEQPRIQGLTIAALGGAGGKGTTGARGRNASCFGRGASPGGPGGDGGDGGPGGDGGNIFVVLPSGSGSLGIEMNVDAGDAGDQGQGGDGGPGGRGLSCPFWNRGSDPQGIDGAEGDPGSRGQLGMARWYNIEDFESETVSAELREIVSLLMESGYVTGAEALEAVRDAVAMRRGGNSL